MQNHVLTLNFVVVTPCILVSSKLLCQKMHSLLKYKMLQLTLKISLYMGSYMFRSVRTIIRELMPDLAKVTVSVELSVKIHRYNCCCAVAICASVCSVYTGCCAACHTKHSTQYTQHILPLHINNFKDVFLLIILQRL
jgi:hypothetical protein